jgi:hypothetical protein
VKIYNKAVGYFPVALFNNLNAADEVGWGGVTILVHQWDQVTFQMVTLIIHVILKILHTKMQLDRGILDLIRYKKLVMALNAMELSISRMIILFYLKDLVVMIVNNLYLEQVSTSIL